MQFPPHIEAQWATLLTAALRAYKRRVPEETRHPNVIMELIMQDLVERGHVTLKCGKYVLFEILDATDADLEQLGAAMGARLAETSLANTRR